MFAMPALLSVYPDGLFVQTHRTPVDAMASVSSLVTILRSAFSDHVDAFAACREAIHYWSATMEKFLRERNRLAGDRIYDLEYDAICRDPMATVRQIYEHFGWSVSPEAERRMRALIAGHAQRQSGNHRYDLSEFGSSPEEVFSAFAPYCQRFGFSKVDDAKRWSSRQSPSVVQTKKRSAFVSVTGNNAETRG
jgi:hypothetical protein